ncbi:MAG: hypothetical protein IJU65_11060 [Desulfovibrio sp.]|nr:hypothetical protein [Desulfovibrio sp.]
MFKIICRCAFTSPCMGSLVLLCGLFFVCPTLLKAADGPRQCILEAGRAVDNADATAFEQLVDVDAILEQALDIFVRRASNPQVARDLPPMLALLFTQAAQKQGSVRALLLNETRAFVLNGVASGAFAGRKPSGAAAQGLLAPLFANASTGRKEVRHVGQARRDGDGWLVPFVVHDGGNGESYDVTGRITGADGCLRLTSVVNIEALLEQVAAESRSVENVAP